MNYYGYTNANTTSSTNFYGTTYFQYIPQPPPKPQLLPPDHPLMLAVKTLGFEVTLENPHLDWPEVQKAFRRLARENHPDHGGDEERMKQITAAYELLKAARG
jgi:hypothetical protein